MCDIYGETCEVWVETVRRARKQHTCCECDAPIPVGHEYVQINSVFDGRGSTDRRHTACVVIWDVIARDLCGHPGYSLLHGLQPEIEEQGEEERAPLEEALDLVRSTYEAFAAQAVQS